MKFPAFTKPAVKKKVIAELAEGLRYLKQTPIISRIIIIMMCLSLLILPYDTMEAVFAKVIFKGNVATYGYIVSSIGLGALIGSFILASLKKGTDLKTVLALSIAMLGAGLVLFSRMSYFPAALVCAVILGLGSITPMSTGITIMQMEAASNMRGRVMSFMALSYFGMLPLGALLIGTLSQKITAPLTMLCQGIAALIIAAISAKLLRKPGPVETKAQYQAQSITTEELTNESSIK
jgi:MFS family permease